MPKTNYPRNPFEKETTAKILTMIRCGVFGINSSIPGLIEYGRVAALEAIGEKHPETPQIAESILTARKNALEAATTWWLDFARIDNKSSWGLMPNSYNKGVSCPAHGDSRLEAARLSLTTPDSDDRILRKLVNHGRTDVINALIKRLRLDPVNVVLDGSPALELAASAILDETEKSGVQPTL